MSKAIVPKSPKKRESSRKAATKKTAGARRAKAEPRSQPSAGRRWMGLIAFGALAVMVSLAIVSFNPADSQAKADGEALQNWIGPVGHAVAYGIFQTLGVSAWGFALALLSLSVLAFTRRGIRLAPLTAFGWLLLGSALSAITHLLATPEKWNYPPGGALGAALADLTQGAFSFTGSLILLLALLLMALLLATHFAIAHAFEAAAQQVGRASVGTVQLFGQAWLRQRRAREIRREQRALERAEAEEELEAGEDARYEVIIEAEAEELDDDADSLPTKQLERGRRGKKSERGEEEIVDAEFRHPEPASPPQERGERAPLRQPRSEPRTTGGDSPRDRERERDLVRDRDRDREAELEPRNRREDQSAPSRSERPSPRSAPLPQEENWSLGDIQAERLTEEPVFVLPGQSDASQPPQASSPSPAHPESATGSSVASPQGEGRSVSGSSGSGAPASTAQSKDSSAEQNSTAEHPRADEQDEKTDPNFDPESLTSAAPPQRTQQASNSASSSAGSSRESDAQSDSSLAPVSTAGSAQASTPTLASDSGSDSSATSDSDSGSDSDSTPSPAPSSASPSKGSTSSSAASPPAPASKPAPSAAAPPASSSSATNTAEPEESRQTPTIIEPRKVPKPVKAPKQEDFSFAKGQTGFHIPDFDEILEGESHDEQSIDHSMLTETAERLRQKLHDLGVDGEVTEIRPGPVVTMYEFRPASGIKLSRIASLGDDLAMAMEALRVRIVAPIPGKGVVGFEVPNKVRQTVFLKEVVEQSVFQKAGSRLTMAIGKDIEGLPYVSDLGKMPHLLIAGTTGSGKSVGVNSMLVSMLMRATPEELRFIMVDPKMLELSIYEGIPHLLLPVVIDPKKAALALRWAVEEMERRYQLLADAGVRNITQYNKHIEKELAAQALAALEAEDSNHSADDGDEVSGTEPEEEKKKLPFIVIVIDELADLMMVAAKDVEVFIARLAQMARAAGIHLMVATQRPSTDVLTGVIKANFPTRISFHVASRHDSATIINSPGAENLLGMGDMLVLPPGTSSLSRVHGAYVSEAEINRLTAFWKAQGAPIYDPDILKPRDEGGGDGEEDEQADVLYDQAIAAVAEMEQISISLLQRKMRIGYNRAARMIERMERDGIVGPADGARPREVLIKPLGEMPGV